MCVCDVIHRGFRLHPKKALQDLSVSLLLDDSDDNVLAYLHRGILYNDIGKYVTSPHVSVASRQRRLTSSH